MGRILIGNIKGPQGDTGQKGDTGAIGPVGPQGPLPALIANYLATEAGKGALDAYMGKLIDQRLTELANGLTKLNGDLEFWNGQMLIVRNTDIDTVTINKVCRMFATTGNVPFGTSGDNDFILVSYRYSGVGETFVVQTAYDIRSDNVKHRRFNNGWKPWHN